MPVPPFHPRGLTQQGELFERILERVHLDLPEAVGLAVTVHDKRLDEDEMTVLAARGRGGEIVAAQLAGLGGPVIDAFVHQVPVLSLDLWADERWPELTLGAMEARAADYGDVWRQVRGSVAVPGVWKADGTVVLSCVLDRPATASTVTTLIGYEQLVCSAMVSAGAEDGTAIADMLAVLQSRGAIEQAKGAIMGRLGCDADAAWATLRRASHESNVKLRSLAVALVEHISGSPAEQPAAGSPIVPDDQARHAAGLLWAVLTHESKPVEPAS
ncbi:ANTAR domain-containing protein [Mycobacterium sp. CVI_P3]|uniref:ANTAR domain-containing protein n=1 Tax=Mycobacterium pinniadriaticum TaxID=2994102 RepID=A0ABT3S913_9MYCO|nr:ANTAR domain-containing protein [Mycobacterium pinniadriaticum]MCX2929566.1 ANTAR domain-containing protein [Mycobacterium pinniadriaticum]MCX2935990.1 ANTAR domain-containing protein [Mycobacterium pinniadriaticum]